MQAKTAMNQFIVCIIALYEHPCKPSSVTCNEIDWGSRSTGAQPGVGRVEYG